MAIIGKDIRLAKEFLQKGQLVGIPTETVYGLAGNALDEKAVLSIFEVKNRPSFDPLIVHTDSVEKLSGLVSEIPDAAYLLSQKFWPGPLTLLLPKKPSVPDLVTSGLDTVAVRIPNHALTLELLRVLDFPLAAPSANPFGYISPTNAKHVDQQLGGKIPYILDGGECGIGIESTIIGFVEGVPTIYRLGGLAIEDIESVVGEVALMAHSSSNPQAPGMLKSHYAPKKPFFLTERNNFPIHEDDFGYLLFDKYIDGIDEKHQRILSPTGNLKEAAHNLFAYLRELDAQSLSQIWAESVPNINLGRAINDRLKRAAAVD
ncbi:L-threonylcarbamoyladenylate synthase [Dyadobacter frigoris]|uniref:Threonylcarbamoyl-AMP synthase n=1 Tax=Dyadobacter frigoris TaxID=2576211 RepID=A0A4U6CZ76_9BACT|nr:L-threonylcarbamoyladenylate synthase [Dyadobacter frigoris]TKT90170.1 threonylcarbamoyl-AMP synthase [Dyadobacter frigoris]GLU52401.1 threonylcarbamoyl-AMP synthase [Dyadobacter frigoris]